MITGYLLDLLYFFVLGIANLVGSFGTVTVNNDFTNSLINFKSYYVSLADYLPLNTILAIVAFELAFETIYFIYKLIRWGYQKVPGIN